MHLADAAEHRLILNGRRRARASLLIGVAFLTLAASSFFSAAPLSSIRLTAGLAATGLAILFLRAGWPIRERVVVDLTAGRIQTSKRAVPFSEALGYSLTTSKEDDDEYPSPSYRVELSLRSAPPLLLLESRCPARVLDDFRRLHERLALPVEPGWGIPATAVPWRSFGNATPPAAAGAVAASVVVRTTDVPARRETSMTVILGGLAVGAIMALEFYGRIRRGDEPLLIDVVLPLVTVGSAVLVGAAIATRTISVTTNGQLSRVVSVLGVPLGRRAVPRSAIRATYAVGARADAPRHVVVDTEHGFLAVPCFDGQALEVKAAIDRIR